MNNVRMTGSYFDYADEIKGELLDLFGFGWHKLPEENTVA